LCIKEDSWLIQTGDYQVFTILSAQIMYAYVMSPESLISGGFWKFIVKCGPISPATLAAVKSFSEYKGVGRINLRELQSGLEAAPRAFPGDATILSPILSKLPHGTISIPHELNTGLLTVLYQVFAKG